MKTGKGRTKEGTTPPPETLAVPFLTLGDKDERVAVEAPTGRARRGRRHAAHGGAPPPPTQEKGKSPLHPSAGVGGGGSPVKKPTS
ncbi:hypothetical protein Taro_036562 [Colocasia esculenta]|uniref:Uncharacterized protein n=1 Tax=Colocasia esculenta TaxID=4460 RepID=A0A843W8R2_COLES|nr:hypothetical protein [Colocasia esculenta]